MKTLSQIAELVGGEVIGDQSLVIRGIAGVTEAQDGDITLAIDKKNLSKAEKSDASVIVVPRELTDSSKTLIVVDNPRFAFAKLLHYFAPPKKVEPGIHPAAVIADGTQLGKQVYLGPNVTISDGTVVGDDTLIMPGVYIGEGVSIGSNTVIHPNVVIESGTRIGSNVIIHAGTVIGSDGYGFVFAEGRHIKVPQVGIVVIEDDVEIGANVAIDRATSGSTIIKKGTKIDNLVHIAHNVVIGEHCLVVAQVGIAGSAKLEKYVTLAGQSGVVGHITVGEKTVLAAKSVIMANTPANSFLMGHPAREMTEEMKVKAATRKTPELLKTVKKLQKRIDELEAKLSGREN